MCAYVPACLPSPPNPLSHQKNLAKITNIFDIQQRSTGLIARKVFSSNLAHISTCSLCSLSQVAAHHKTTGVVFITLGLIRFLTMYNSQFSILTSYIDYHICYLQPHTLQSFASPYIMHGYPVSSSLVQELMHLHLV